MSNVPAIPRFGRFTRGGEGLCKVRVLGGKNDAMKFHDMAAQMLWLMA
jgi:hypothetical protein